MEIFEHGSKERIEEFDRKRDGYLYFYCDRCGCKFGASVKYGEILVSQYDGDSAVCPECGYKTFTSSTEYFKLP